MNECSKMEIPNKLKVGGQDLNVVFTNTIYHELTHAILDTMGEFELSANERFVCSFAGFLSEAVRSFEYNKD